MEQFLEKPNLVLMNNGALTRIVYETETASDLTMCSANIAATFDWSISASSGDSDHCHIVLSYEEERNDANQPNTTVWKVKCAVGSM